MALLLGLKCAACLWIGGGVLIMIGIIMGAVLHEVVLQNAFNNFFVYKQNEAWTDPAYEECTDQFFNVFLFHLNNSDQVRMPAKPEAPQYVEIGPFNFSRYVCKFDAELIGNREFYREYYSRYQFHPVANGPREDTNITNLNAAWFGIMNAVYRKAASFESELEKGLLFQLMSAKFNETFALLNTQDTIERIYENGIAVQTDAVLTDSALRKRLEARRLKLAFDANFTSAEDFLNNVQMANSVAATANGTVTCATQLYLEDPSALLFNASQVLALDPALQDETYQFFRDVVTLGNTATFRKKYELTLCQGTALLATLYPSSVNAGWRKVFSITTSAIDQDLRTQWLYGTVIPTGLDLDNDGATPDGFELACLNSSVFGTNQTAGEVDFGLEDTDVALLLESSTTSQRSLRTFRGVHRWRLAASNATELLALRQEVNNIGATAAAAIAQWVLTNYNRMIPTLLQRYRALDPTVLTADDIPWFQFGSGSALLAQSPLDKFSSESVAARYSVLSLYDEKPSYPYWEFGVAVRSTEKCRNCVKTIQLSANTTKILFNDPQVGIFDADRMVDFLLLLNDWKNANNGVTKAEKELLLQDYGLSSEQLLTSALFFTEFFPNFVVEPDLIAEFKKPDGTPIITRTARDILWEAHDSILGMARPENDRCGFLYDEYEAMSRAEAERQPKKNVTVYLGGDRNDVEEYYKDVYFLDSKVINIWKEDILVEGTIGHFRPGFNEKTFKPKVFSSGLGRSLDFVRKGTTSEKGIALTQYGLAPSMWENGIENPANDKFWMGIHGLINITANLKPIETLLSRPHQYGVAPSYPRGTRIDGFERNNLWFADWEIAADHESGLAMRKHITIQLNLGNKFSIGKKRDWCARNIAGAQPTDEEMTWCKWRIDPNVYPMFWVDDFDSISSANAATFISAVGFAKGAAWAFYIGFTLLGATLFVFGLIVYVLWKRRGSEKTTTRKAQDVELKEADLDMSMQNI